MSELALLIRRRRNSLGLTQRQAAERAALSLSTWQALERETPTPTGFQQRTLTRAARALGLSSATLHRAAGLETATDEVDDPHDFDDAPHREIAELREQLLELHRHAPASFTLVYQHATETVDHLLDLHTDP